MKRLSIALLGLLLPMLTYAQTSINWDIGPVRFSYNTSYGFSVSANRGIVTTLGRFSIEHTRNLSGNSQDLIVIFRDRNKGYYEKDLIYRINGGANLEADISGGIKLYIEKGKVLVDITNVDSFTVSFTKKKSATNIPKRTTASTATVRNNSGFHGFVETDNLYFCTKHRRYFSYKERTAHYNCTNAIKNPNVKWCLECSVHYGPDQALYHGFHFQEEDIQKFQIRARSFYCETCRFEHYVPY